MEHDENLLESEVVTLSLDDDEEVECAIITRLKMNEVDYIVLLPLDENGESESGDVWIYRFAEDPSGEGNHDIINIEDDEEYDAICDLFDEWLDTQEFNEMDDEE